MIPSHFVLEINQFVAQLPSEMIEKIVAALQQPASGWARLRRQVIEVAPQPAVRDQIAAFLDRWHATTPEISNDSLALALLVAAHAEQQTRHDQSLELVWTGPDSHVIPLRRTDQALIQIINEALQKLTIVSFAVYKATSIMHALKQAAQRGVSITLCLEMPDASEGKVAFDAIKTLEPEIAQRAQLVVWPHEQRPHSPDGRHGSLHAKVAVADGKTLLISSANLTEYAMTLNMELGVLIRGGELPAKVEAHFAKLIEQGILRML
ncbi:Cardiolipin synthase B [Anaerolineae bacterium]|nr:Cardiolipin synthase B [Anaerolineae bacterium]